MVASILASLGKGHVLDGENAALQDTNDHVMANLQKDGTYSVVPRIPGGRYARGSSRWAGGRTSGSTRRSPAASARPFGARARAGHVLDGENAALQDTNDHVMANLQKDGTYSVVPRIPGGEVTPEGLIAIGQVASDFGLYTKITGGQRIDLFGARIEQLPAIWERLVEAGFESGHAYGKALRTVKSCVGQTWCRYGVQDSVGLAIALELRYRGLRSPHKLKLARVRLRPRVRRGARQGRRRHRHRERLEPLRRRQRRLHAAARPAVRART